MPHVPEHYLQKVGALFMALPTANMGDAAIGIVTLGTLIVWPRLGIRLRPPACVAAGLCGNGHRQHVRWSCRHHRLAVPLCSGGRFSGQRYSSTVTTAGSSRDMPGSSFTLSWDSLRALLPAAFSMAMLGAIESLLCAVVLDGMTGTKHKANSELVGGLR